MLTKMCRLLQLLLMLPIKTSFNAKQCCNDWIHLLRKKMCVEAL